MSLFLFVLQFILIYWLYNYSYKPLKELKQNKIKSIEDLPIEQQKEYVSYLEALNNNKRIVIDGKIIQKSNDILVSGVYKDPISLKNFEQLFIKSLKNSKQSLLIENAIKNHKQRINMYDEVLKEIQK